jgi:hypothetical protein
LDRPAIRTRPPRLSGWLTKPARIRLGEPQGIGTHIGSRTHDRSRREEKSSMLKTIRPDLIARVRGFHLEARRRET